MKSLLSTTLAVALVLVSFGASAETVTVKYRVTPVNLAKFNCPALKESSFVNRICYDAENLYMVILLQRTYYHYCEIDRGTVAELVAAPSLGRHYNQNIKGRFDCRTGRVPQYP